MTELPQDPEFLAQGDERALLESFLEFYRAILIRKAEGLSDREARTATIEPSDLTLMGLVRHMAEVERNWFRRWLLADTAATPIYYTDADPDGDLHPGADDTLDEALLTLKAEIAIARMNVAATASLDVVARHRSETRAHFQPSLRWILIHMIEEYARHCGHADLLRQRIDGRTGD